jgi:hypothetical protein
MLVLDDVLYGDLKRSRMDGFTKLMKQVTAGHEECECVTWFRWIFHCLRLMIEVSAVLQC